MRNCPECNSKDPQIKMLFVQCEDLDLYYVQCASCGYRGPYVPTKDQSVTFWEMIPSPLVESMKLHQDFITYPPKRRHTEHCAHSVLCDIPVHSFGPNFDNWSDCIANIQCDSRGRIVAIEPEDTEDEKQC